MSEFIDQITHNFHFIRPNLLWTLVPVGILVFLLFRKSSGEEKWKKDIPQHLAGHLIVKGRENSKLPRILLIIMLLIGVFAVAGPTWKEVEKGGVQSKSSLVIALDLSRSMLATDIQPNRLERAKAKIIDLLDKKPGMPAALLGYAASAHTVLHFTNDYNTLKYLLEHVSPGVMPVQGTSMRTALKLADSLLKTMELPGVILVITDDLPANDLNWINEYSSRSRNKIEFLLIATPSGAPIPVSRNKFLKDDRGNTVIPVLNTNIIPEFVKLSNVQVNLTTLDNSDIEKILSGIKQNLEFEKKKEEENREWEDYGYWFMLPVVLILLLWFRKGWVVSWMIIFFTSSWFGCQDQNGTNYIKTGFQFIDLWFTRDQQAQKLFDERKYSQAAATYDDLFWKGVSLYKARHFQNAAQIFYQIKTPQGYFNLGMCMAELENWNEAVFAFEESAKLHPEYEEARQNLAEIKKLIPKKKKMQLVTPQSLEDKMFGKSEELDQESEEEGDREEQAGGEKSDLGQMAAQMGQQDQEISFPDGSEQQQQQVQKEILLKQMSDDPAVFLKRKFELQYRKNKDKIDKPENKW